MFAVDDDIESSTKFEALDELPSARRSRAFEAWLRLGAACKKRGNGGVVSPGLVAKILHAWTAADRQQAIADLVAANGGRSNGLLVVDGDSWRFHEWEQWQPSREEADAERAKRTKGAERQRRWRLNKRLGETPDDDAPRDDESVSRDVTRNVSRSSRRDATRDGPSVTSNAPRDVTRDVTGDVTRDVSSVSHGVSRARVPVPSRPVDPEKDLPRSVASVSAPDETPPTMPDASLVDAADAAPVDAPGDGDAVEPEKRSRVVKTWDSRTPQFAPRKVKTCA